MAWPHYNPSYIVFVCLKGFIWRLLQSHLHIFPMNLKSFKKKHEKLKKKYANGG